MPDATPHLESVINVQQVILAGLKRLFLDIASDVAKLLANFIRIVATTGDLEPTVFAIISKLGLCLCQG